MRSSERATKEAWQASSRTRQRYEDQTQPQLIAQMVSRAVDDEDATEELPERTTNDLR